VQAAQADPPDGNLFTSQSRTLAAAAELITVVGSGCVVGVVASMRVDEVWGNWGRKIVSGPAAAVAVWTVTTGCPSPDLLPAGSWDGFLDWGDERPCQPPATCGQTVVEMRPSLTGARLRGVMDAQCRIGSQYTGEWTTIALDIAWQDAGHPEKAPPYHDHAYAGFSDDSPAVCVRRSMSNFHNLFTSRRLAVAGRVAINGHEFDLSTFDEDLPPEMFSSRASSVAVEQGKVLCFTPE
jgi:hypothetical protein